LGEGCVVGTAVLGAHLKFRRSHQPTRDPSQDTTERTHEPLTGPHRLVQGL
jgi:hypothetical protein